MAKRKKDLHKLFTSIVTLLPKVTQNLSKENIEEVKKILKEYEKRLEEAK